MSKPKTPRKSRRRCRSCKGTGVLFFCYESEEGDAGRSTIERCDFCRRYKSDRTASLAVQRVWRSACNKTSRR